MAVNFNEMTIPALRQCAANKKINLSGLRVKKNIINRILIKSPNRGNRPKPPPVLEKINPNDSDTIAKAMFINPDKVAKKNGESDDKKDAEDTAGQLVDTGLQEANASNFMSAFMTPEDKAEFKKKWKELAAQQVMNGSFLEFQGMRFVTGDAEVYDSKRDNTNAGRDVFRHILQPATNTRLYLKSKFTLTTVNTGPSPVCRNGPTWASLKDIWRVS